MTIQLNWKTPTKICMFQPSSLPAEYQEVEYIQSSWTQYFIVWTSFKTEYKSVMDFQMTVIWWDYVPLWVLNNSGQRYGIDVRGWNFTVITWWWNWNNTISEDTNRHLFTVDKSTVTVDGTSYSSQYSSYTFNKWVWIFGYHNTASGTVSYLASAKLYKLDIYDENWTLIYDLVPCYRKQDTEIWMYDLINNVFYTNSWTWTFTKWNDVNWVEQEIKRVTIRPNGTEKQIRPVWWRPWANTLLYLPLESDVVDQSGKTWRTFNTAWLTYTTVDWITSVHVGSTWGIQITAPYPIANSSMSEQTISVCVTIPAAQSSNRRDIMELAWRNWCWVRLMFRENTTNIYTTAPNGWWDDLITSFLPYAWTWANLILVNSSAWRKLYINWQLAVSWTWSSTPRWNYTANYENNQMLLTWRTSLTYWESLEWNAREIILEDKAWTVQEVANYSTWIKNKLGF